MSKYTRKKQNPAVKTEDEFVSFWSKAYQRLAPYARAIAIIVASALVLLFVVWGIEGLRERRAQAADAEYAAASRIYAAELLPADAKEVPLPKEGDAPRFKTEKERADAALAALDTLDKNHGASTAAKTAKLLRGNILFSAGRTDDAAKAFDAAYAEAPSASVKALAAEGRGLCAEAAGKLDDALVRFQEMDGAAGPGNFGRDRALYNQGRILVKKGEKAKALTVFKEALAKVPQTPLKEDVQTQVLLLEGGPAAPSPGPAPGK